MLKSRIFLFKVIFTASGSIGGFLYWKFIGCSTGTCPIKSVWYLSSLWGMAMGYLMGDLVGSLIWKRKIENE